MTQVNSVGFQGDDYQSQKLKQQEEQYNNCIWNGSNADNNIVEQSDINSDFWNKCKDIQTLLEPYIRGAKEWTEDLKAQVQGIYNEYVGQPVKMEPAVTPGEDMQTGRYYATLNPDGTTTVKDFKENTVKIYKNGKEVKQNQENTTNGIDSLMNNVKKNGALKILSELKNNPNKKGYVVWHNDLEIKYIMGFDRNENKYFVQYYSNNEKRKIFIPDKNLEPAIEALLKAEPNLNMVAKEEEYK